MAANNIHYDAFISYRHSDLDSFVAENLHKELEKFRLPSNLVKERGAGTKTKIERVFRDRDELPISADLSENIMKALEESDFLIVICSPRLRESIWCQSEIENFIRLKGREKVLAVLADGEPQESFPESITRAQRIVKDDNGNEITETYDVEPLAADVRGLSKKEIKKKIKEEVIRLAAAIFNCNYDEIKQRHREEKLKKKFMIASVVSIIALVFAAVVSFMAVMLNQKSRIIKEQYREILIDESKMVENEVLSMLSQGNVVEGNELIANSFKGQGNKLPDEVQSTLRRTLGELLHCYENGDRLRPVTNLCMEATIKIISVSQDNKYIAVFDINNNLAIFDLSTMSKVFEKKTDFTSGEENMQNYGFDGSDNFFYLGNNSFCRIDCNSGKEIWCTQYEKGKRFASIDKEYLMVAANNTLYKVAKADGQSVAQYSVDNMDYHSLVYYMALNGDSSCMAVMVSIKDKVHILNINTDNLSLINSREFNEGLAKVMVNNKQGKLLVQVFDKYTDSTTADSNPKLYILDEKTLDTNTTCDLDYLLVRMMTYGDKLLAYYSGGIIMMNPNTGHVDEIYQLNREISDIIVNADGMLRLYLKDGSQKIQDRDSLSFYENLTNYVEPDNLVAFKYAGKYTAMVIPKSDMVSIYSRMPSDEATEVALDESIKNKEYEYADMEIIKDGNTLVKVYTEEELGKNIGEIVVYPETDKEIRHEVSTSFIKGVYPEVKSNSIVILYKDYTVELRDMETYELKNTLNCESSCFVDDMDDNYFAIGDGISAYVINRKNLQCEAKVYGYMHYDTNSKAFVLSEGISEDTAYTVPFHSYEELMDMLTNN